MKRFVAGQSKKVSMKESPPQNSSQPSRSGQFGPPSSSVAVSPHRTPTSLFLSSKQNSPRRRSPTSEKRRSNSSEKKLLLLSSQQSRSQSASPPNSQKQRCSQRGPTTPRRKPAPLLMSAEISGSISRSSLSRDVDKRRKRNRSRPGTIVHRVSPGGAPGSVPPRLRGVGGVSIRTPAPSIAMVGKSLISNHAAVASLARQLSNAAIRRNIQALLRGEYDDDNEEEEEEEFDEEEEELVVVGLEREDTVEKEESSEYSDSEEECEFSGASSVRSYSSSRSFSRTRRCSSSSSDEDEDLLPAGIVSTKGIFLGLPGVRTTVTATLQEIAGSGRIPGSGRKTSSALSPRPAAVNGPFLIGPCRKTPDPTRLVLILDLDETMVAARCGPNVTVRPHIFSFLTAARACDCEIVVWTAGVHSHTLRSLAAISQVFGDATWYDHVISRNSRWYTCDVQSTKNLKFLGRPLSRCLLIDNSPQVVVQPSNTLMVEDYFGGDNADHTFQHCETVLKHVVRSLREGCDYSLPSPPRLSMQAVQIPSSSRGSLGNEDISTSEGMMLPAAAVQLPSTSPAITGLDPAAHRGRSVTPVPSENTRCLRSKSPASRISPALKTLPSPATLPSPSLPQNTGARPSASNRNLGGRTPQPPLLKSEALPAIINSVKEANGHQSDAEEYSGGTLAVTVADALMESDLVMTSPLPIIPIGMPAATAATAGRNGGSMERSKVRKSHVLAYVPDGSNRQYGGIPVEGFHPWSVGDANKKNNTD